MQPSQFPHYRRLKLLFIQNSGPGLVVITKKEVFIAQFTEDKKHLLSIAEAINEAQGYLGNADYNDLNLREDLKESIAKTMQDIGVAARQLSDTFKERYRDIDWDVLVNLEYTTYNQDVEVETDMQPVFNMIRNDFPEIKDYVLSYIDEIEKAEFE